MPMRVKFMKRRGLDYFTKLAVVSTTPNMAGNEYVLTKPILQQCPESNLGLPPEYKEDIK